MSDRTLRIAYRNPQFLRSKTSSSAANARSASCVKPQKWLGVPLMPSLADQLQQLARVNPNALLAIQGFVRDQLAGHISDERADETDPAWGWQARVE